MAENPLESSILELLMDRQVPMEHRLSEWVGMSSQSIDKSGVDALNSLLEKELEDLGFRTAALVDGVRGSTVVARRREETQGHRLLLLGHTDTVHPNQGAFSTLEEVPGIPGRLTGPGAADMKGGLVVMLEALRALDEAGALKGRSITVVINGDEEIGSPSSADLIRAEAMESHLALGFEAGRPLEDGGSTIVSRRRGFGRLVLEARGKAAHAGVDPSEGASAVLELCHKAIDLSALDDPRNGVSVTVGMLNGGTAANVVPEVASLALDYRFPDEDARTELEDAIYNIASRNVIRSSEDQPLVGTTMQDQLGRPAMERSEAMGRMVRRIVDWGAEFGILVEEESRGGSSDAALAADVGCPAICGMGVVGDGFHTKDEWIDRTSLVPRAQLAAITMHRFFEL